MISKFQRKQRDKYRLLQLIKPLNRKEGYIKIYPNNSFLHEKVKSDIAIYLKQLGFDVYTEVEFIKGGRADIVGIDTSGDGYIIEILHSEKKLNKNKAYPVDFTIKQVRTHDFDISKFSL